MCHCCADLQVLTDETGCMNEAVQRPFLLVSMQHDIVARGQQPGSNWTVQLHAVPAYNSAHQRQQS